MQAGILSLTLALCVVLPTGNVQAQTVRGTEVTFIKDARRIPDPTKQRELGQRNGWRQFKAAHTRWNTEFNELTGLPRRAYGDPIPVGGNSPEEKAMAFMSDELSAFNLPLNELVPRAVAPTSKLTYVHFKQVHEGLEVLGATATVKVDPLGRVISFGTDLHRDITVDMTPSVAGDAAVSAASNGLEHIHSSDIIALRILPVPDEGRVDMRLVHEVLITTLNGDNKGKYRCLVDAHTGVLWYRTNEVLTCDHGDGGDAGVDVQMTASAYTGSPLDPVEVQDLPHLEVRIDGTTYYTDENGFLASGVPGPATAQFSMRGRYAEVITANVNPSFISDVQEGANTISFNANANVRERSAYLYVNQIHEHVVNVLPGFTSLDIPLPTRLDLTTGDCNANYDGTGINFFLEGNNCRSLATINDVVYHEYGHAVNDRFYQSQSSNFTNGGMNEGYADVWALTLTQSPILGQGINLDDDNSTVRRYDEAPKVFPVDLVGQVHADGEIICGAWWDTYLLLGSDMELTLDLFEGAFPGLQAATFNGNEGQAFRDVLLDVLQVDDDDSDITNGTPNGAAIVEGFNIHGITLISDAQIFHEDVLTAPEQSTIPINVEVVITFPATEYLESASLFYKVNNATDWETTSLDSQGGSTYVGNIPPQPAGTVVAYYVGLTDIFGQLSSVTPIAANRADPGLPYYIMVGYDLEATENADGLSELGEWAESIPSDNATTGRWEFGAPIGSYGDVNDPSTVVQPGEQHTENGELCWFTSNATLLTSPLGESDVDDGTTTLISSIIDLSEFSNPAFSYWRWYTNNPPSGANPNADWWQVSASADNGNTWFPVEDTKSGQREWRRKVFRVQDVLGDVSSIRIMFQASDSIRPGVNLDGGSLVEAAIDDIELWDMVIENSVNTLDKPTIGALWPSPASDAVFVSYRTAGGASLRGMEVLDMTGRTVLVPQITNSTPQRIDIGSLAEGQYVLRIRWENGTAEERFNVLH